MLFELLNRFSGHVKGAKLSASVDSIGQSSHAVRLSFSLLPNHAFTRRMAGLSREFPETFLRINPHSTLAESVVDDSPAGWQIKGTRLALFRDQGSVMLVSRHRSTRTAKKELDRLMEQCRLKGHSVTRSEAGYAVKLSD